MAKIKFDNKYNNPENHLNQADKNGWPDWDDESGVNVQEFIKSQLENSIVDVNFEQGSDPKIQGINAFGQVVSEVKAVIAEPVYAYDIKIKKVNIGSFEFLDSDALTTIELNYNPDLRATATIQIYTIQTIAGDESYIREARTVNLYWIDQTGSKQLLYGHVDNQVVNSCLEGQTVTIDITPMFKQGFSNLRLIAELVDEKASGTKNAFKANTNSIDNGIPFYETQIILSAPTSPLSVSTTENANAFVLNISGISDNYSDYELQYYEYDPAIANVFCKAQTPISLSSASQVSLLLSKGTHYIYARVKKKNDVIIQNIPVTVASDWIQLNLLVQTSATSNNEGTAIITDIPQSLTNCNSTKLYRICTTDKRSCNLTVSAYLATTNQNISSEENLFNRLDINLLSTDEGIDKSYYTYIELENINSFNNQRFARFAITDANGETTYIPQFSVSGTTVSANLNFVLQITQPITNLQNQFNYDTTSTPILNFSQIARGNVFDSQIINPNLSSADGWSTDQDVNGATYTVFKASPTELGLFVKEQDGEIVANPLMIKNNSGNSLLGTNQNFSIEIMLKSEYINDMNDEIMSIGNIRFYPGYLGVYNETTREIDEDSRADYEREKPTHIIITYTQNYRPSTYSTLYDSLLSNYSTQGATYNCLKIYVNGTINREVMVNPSQLMKDGKFEWQVNPKNSNVLFYIFRTYETALNYNQLKKNYISSRLYLSEKEIYYNNNNILFTPEDGFADKVGQISLRKCLDKYNVLLVAQKASDQPDNVNFTDRPLYWNNKDQSIKATLLVRYKSEENKPYSGKLYGGSLKAQGSSAKKYLMHNTSYSKFKFVPEYNADSTLNPSFAKPENTGQSFYKMPPYESSDANGNSIKITPEQKIKKLVGKVNYASSMQSHKQGACKLYNDVFEALYGNVSLNGGRKTVLEEAFLYFFVTTDDLANIAWTDDVIDSATFVGFQTWGSAKGDEESWGYDKNLTPEYLLFEGADNQSMGANFKVPWAAMQRWSDVELNSDGRVPTTYSPTVQQRTAAVTDGDCNTGLIIKEETILYQTSKADALDVDFGFETYKSAKLKEGSETEYEDSDYCYFKPKVIANTLPKFVELYNLLYLFDYSNYIDIPTDGANYTGAWTDIWKSTGPNNNQFHADCSQIDYYYKLVIPYNATVYINNSPTSEVASQGDVYRWDTYEARWVPAGTHYDNNSWRTLNVIDFYKRLYQIRTGAELNRNTLGLKIETSIKDLFVNYSQHFTAISGNTFVYFQGGFANDVYTPGSANLITFKLALADLFKATCEKYLDVDDFKFHQGFIRYVSGTDNRAKNTYFKIQGNLYEEHYDYTLASEISNNVDYYKSDGSKLINNNDGTLKEFEDSSENYLGEFYTKSEVSYVKKSEQNPNVNKVVCKQDDLDTIFATDNNGQQNKPYSLLEPPYNHDTEELWGDMRSALFYNFDITYSNDIIVTLGQIINRATPNSIKFTDSKSLIKKYFLNIQESFPAIAYNHTAEIYYETAQSLYQGSGLTNYGQNSGLRTIEEKTFNNNSVAYPLSLSHGSCYESEIQFLTDRFKFLNTMCNAGSTSDNTMSLITGTGASGSTITFKGKASYTQYLYPSFGNGSKSIVQNYENIRGFTYDSIIPSLYDVNTNPNITILEQAVPNNKYDFELLIQQTVTGASISQTESYKTIEITGGLDRLKDLVAFPNASEVIVDGVYEKVIIDEDREIDKLTDVNVANYTLNITDTVVKDKLPCIQKLKLVNVRNTQTNAKLDFRGCDRLSDLDLTGCSGFTTINLPTSNTLTNVILPSSLTSLTMDYYPNLTSENFNFDSDEVNLTSLIIDCRNQSELIDKLLSFCSNETALELRTNSDLLTIKIPKSTIDKICSKSNLTVTGKLIIEIIDPETNELYAITLSDKNKYVKAWGNIDTINNSINSQLLYKQVPITVLNIKANNTVGPVENTEINTLDAIGGSIVGNTVQIVTDQITNTSRLNITYSLAPDSPKKTATFSNNTNSVIFTESGVYYITMQAVVLNTNNQPLTVYCSPNYCSVHVGFRAPEIGDYAYSDGTFANFIEENKTIVGLVIYSVLDPSTNEYDVRVVSNTAITAVDKTLQRNASTIFTGLKDQSTNQHPSDLINRGKTQYHVQELANSYGRKTSAYTSPEEYSSQSGKITFSLSDTIEQPTNLSCGLPITAFYKKQADAMYAVFKGVNTTLTADNIETAITEFANISYDSIVYDRNYPYGGYYALLNPAYTKTYLFEPDNLVPIKKNNQFITHPYSRNHWYIPTADEIKLVILYRIISAKVVAGQESYARWNSNEWRSDAQLKDLGTKAKYAIFNNGNADLPILNVGSYITCNKNNGTTYLTYGAYSNYNNYADDIGWHYSYSDWYYYVDNHVFADYSLDKIVPFCKVLVSNNNGKTDIRAYEP